MDRRAIGTEVRWFTPGRTVVGLFDYDVEYSVVNMAMLLGTFELPGRYTLTASLDHHKSPYLTTRNALSGQPVESLKELVHMLGEPAVRSLAEDRTADADTISVGVSHPLGTRFQWTADATATRISDLIGVGWSRSRPGHRDGNRARGPVDRQQPDAVRGRDHPGSASVRRRRGEDGLRFDELAISTVGPTARRTAAAPRLSHIHDGRLDAVAREPRVANRLELTAHDR